MNLEIVYILDRSWARRARTGSSTKKRPDLLNINFGEDRERPNSPSPLAETKPLPAEEAKPRFVHLIVFSFSTTHTAS